MMREYYADDRHAYNEARARVALLDFLRDPSLAAPGSSATRTPLGYIVLTFGHSLEYLGRVDELFLIPPYRGRGWGRATWTSSRKPLGPQVSVPSISRSSAQIQQPKRFSAGYSDHSHRLMSKWIEQGFPKPGSTPE
jgi:hypothetical protein